MSQREVHVYQARGEHSVHALFGLSSEVGLFVIQAFNWKSNGRGIQNPGYPVARLWVLSQNPFSLHSYDVVLVSSCAHLVQQSEDIRPLNCFSTLYHFHAPNKFKSCCRHDYEHLLRKSVPSVAGCYQTWRFVQRHFFTSDNPLDPSPRILLLDDFPISNILFWQAEKQHMANLLVTDLSPHWRQARGQHDQWPKQSRSHWNMNMNTYTYTYMKNLYDRYFIFPSWSNFQPPLVFQNIRRGR